MDPNQQNQNSQPNIPLQIDSLPQTINETPHSSNNWFKIFLAVLVLIIVGGGGYLLGTRKNQTVVQELKASISPTFVQSSPTPDPTANWREFKLNSVPIIFKLPSQIYKEGDYSETLVPGLKGTNICFRLLDKTSFRIIPFAFAGGLGMCPDQKSNSSFIIGGTSIDFEAPRSGMFTDFQGFEEKEGKFYARFVGGSLYEIPSDVVTKVNNNFGVSIIKTKYKESTDGVLKEIPMMGTPNEGFIGALINTNDLKHPGLAISMRLDNSFNEQLFDKILSTFKFTDQIQTTKKSYTSEEYAFIVEYPSTVIHEEIIDSTKVNKSHEYFKINGGVLEIYGVCGRGVQPIKQQDITIAGEKTIKFYETDSNGVISAIKRPNSNESLCFNFTLPKDPAFAGQTDQLFDQILSTLKFTQ